MSATPYSDRWREVTAERMERLRLGPWLLVTETGLPHEDVFKALQSGEVSHETSGPIDELLDAREAESDAYAVEFGGRQIEVRHEDGRRHRVERVHVDLGALTVLGVRGRE